MKNLDYEKQRQSEIECYENAKQLGFKDVILIGQSQISNDDFYIDAPTPILKGYLYQHKNGILKFNFIGRSRGFDTESAFYPCEYSENQNKAFQITYCKMNHPLKRIDWKSVWIFYNPKYELNMVNGKRECTVIYDSYAHSI